MVVFPLPAQARLSLLFALFQPSPHRIIRQERNSLSHKRSIEILETSAFTEVMR